MKFSPVPGYTFGALDVCGCMGMINAHHFVLDDIPEELEVMTLRENLLKIAAHYGTEPPQVNFSTLTSFFNPFIQEELRGGILGIDILKPTFSLVETIQYSGREIPVYDLSPVLKVTGKYLERFPLYLGCHVFEASTEYSSFLYADEKCGDEQVRIYSGIAVGVPERGCRLLMEDSGYIIEDAEKADVIRSLAQSILVCEKIENNTSQIEYKDIYVLVDVSDPLIKDEDNIFCYGKGVIPSWTQTQFMYVIPPEEFVPDDMDFDDLRNIRFEEWLEHVV